MAKQPMYNYLSPLIEMSGKKKGTRADALRYVWMYINDNNLKDPNKTGQIICDSLLKEFTGKSKIKNTGLMGCISAHIEKI